ncbi:MAG: class I SAM-dependent methyltransferase [Rhodothermales bacterium]
MRLDLVSESLLERFLHTIGLVPDPLVHTLVALLMSRSIMAGVRLGVFEALADGALTDGEVATKCGTDAHATRKLLYALQGVGYVRLKNGRYALTRTARKWLLRDSQHDLTDAILHRYLDLRLIDQAEVYLRDGKPIDFHSHLSTEDWSLYLRGQKAHTSVAISEIVSKTPLPHGAARILDVGGSHGLYSDAMCRRHAGLSSVVMDLPEAIGQVDREGICDRVTFESGNVLTDDLGDAIYDLVFIANLVHHFDADQNQELLRKAARSLRAGGVCVIADFILPESSRKTAQFTALLNFYFAVTSGGGAWSADEMLSWMRRAELKTRRPIRIRRAPGFALLAGTKRG